MTTTMQKKASEARSAQNTDHLIREVADLKELSLLLLDRIDRRFKELAAAEAAADRRLMELIGMLQRSGTVNTASAETSKGGRPHEVAMLSRRGMKSGEIANVLGMAVGEVELMLNMGSSNA